MENVKDLNLTEEEIEKAKNIMVRRYNNKWRKQNPAKVREYQRKYYLRRAKAMVESGEIDISEIRSNDVPACENN